MVVFVVAGGREMLRADADDDAGRRRRAVL
jgi:hypothetical protein